MEHIESSSIHAKGGAAYLTYISLLNSSKWFITKGRINKCGHLDSYVLSIINTTSLHCMNFYYRKTLLYVQGSLFVYCLLQPKIRTYMSTVK